MASVSTFLNFERSTEAAFEFYRSVFGGDFNLPIRRMRDGPQDPARPLSAADAELVLHVELTILGGHVLMGNDAPASLGFALRPGNNTHINLETDSPAQTDSLFAQLSAGGVVETRPQDMFWGYYYGACTDRFGVQWMISCKSVTSS